MSGLNFIWNISCHHVPQTLQASAVVILQSVYDWGLPNPIQCMDQQLPYYRTLCSLHAGNIMRQPPPQKKRTAYITNKQTMKTNSVAISLQPNYANWVTSVAGEVSANI
jgi:hypothetical protein